MIEPRVRVLDSITRLAPEYAGTVLVAGSHGGRYCAFLAAAGRLRAVVLHDAGVGRHRAGIGALPVLDALGMPAATVSHLSARIGDGADMLARGSLSHVNRLAFALGCRRGQAAEEALERLARARPCAGPAPDPGESRTVLAPGPIPAIGCDSASLVRPEDEDTFIVTGSHGGILANRPDYGLAVRAAGAVFNDAGVGVDRAGTRRLDVLERQGVPAATVSAESARIGEARSAWATGILSHVNGPALALGASPGMTVRALYRRVAERGGAGGG